MHDCMGWPQREVLTDMEVHAWVHDCMGWSQREMLADMEERVCMASLFFYFKVHHPVSSTALMEPHRRGRGPMHPLSHAAAW